MRQTLALISFAVLIASCSGNSGSDNQDTVSTGDQAAAARQSEVDTSVNNIGMENNTSGNYEKGSQLIASSDCLTCHKVDEKLVGPAYKDVAKKYEATDKNINYLVGKIIQGGSGVWGEVPMTPHPTLSENDAKEMVKYILSLK